MRQQIQISKEDINSKTKLKNKEALVVAKLNDFMGLVISKCLYLYLLF